MEECLREEASTQRLVTKAQTNLHWPLDQGKRKQHVKVKEMQKLKVCPMDTDAPHLRIKYIYYIT